MPKNAFLFPERQRRSEEEKSYERKEGRKGDNN